MPRSATKRRALKRSRYDCFLGSARPEWMEYTRTLALQLANAGLSCFIDTLPLSDTLNVIRRTALQTSRVLVEIGDPSSFLSENTQIDIGFFRSADRLVVGIILGDGSHQNPLSTFGIHILFIDHPLTTSPRASIIDHIVDFCRKEPIPSLQNEEPPITSAEESHPLNEGKLILVGRGEVGKTSLVRRLVHNEFRGDESKTQGINITKWSVSCQAAEIRLNIWDFGGQEIMHATHQFFLTERSLYVLVLNGRGGGEDEDAEYWLKHIESFGGASPVILVQNKIAQHSFDLNYRGLQGRYPQIRGFVKTDCELSIGVEYLKEKIQEVLSDMHEVRMRFPLHWFKVKRHLEGMREDFMGYEAFHSLCQRLGVLQESDREMLSWVLHCLGIALNYRDDSRLRETSVLKPEWVTHGIYQILNAKTIAERQGELHLDDLRQLLPKGRYPVEKHFFLLEIMRKFSLCFAFPDDRDRYLIPELLGKEEPQEASDFLTSDSLGFEYQYAVLPEGLIPRFIARSHTLSRGQERWRFGVILAHEGCKALIKAQPGDRRVIIRVKGENSGARRRLLAIIRYDLDRIHGEFKDRLEVQAKVPLPRYPSFSVDYHKLVAFESRGVTDFPEFVGQDVVVLRVSDLLDGVDLNNQRDHPIEIMAHLRSIFFSYSHKDESLRDELETHLKLLQRQGIISMWHDRKILPGSEWDKEIDRNLDRASIILFLVSSDFIASNYCWDKEVRRAMERHEAGEATVIPVFLRACDWRFAPFGKLQGLPKDVRPVTAWPDRDAAWTDVAKGIRASAQGLD